MLAIKPRYGEVYRVAGDQAARNYRFDEAVALTRRALELDEHNPHGPRRSRYDLLRRATTRGAAALERAFKDDPFDVGDHNSLAMLDSLDKFLTVSGRGPDLPFPPGRGGGHARTRHPAGQGSARGAVQALSGSRPRDRS